MVETYDLTKTIIYKIKSKRDEQFIEIFKLILLLWHNLVFSEMQPKENQTIDLYDTLIILIWVAYEGYMHERNY
jgi:hypothetical protein